MRAAQRNGTAWMYRMQSLGSVTMNRHDWTPQNWRPVKPDKPPIIRIRTVMLLIAIAGAYYLGYEYGLDTMYGWLEDAREKSELSSTPSSHPLSL
jgi:hypothetical protein